MTRHSSECDGYNNSECAHPDHDTLYADEAGYAAEVTAAIAEVWATIEPHMRALLVASKYQDVTKGLTGMSAAFTKEATKAAYKLSYAPLNEELISVGRQLYAQVRNDLKARS